MTKEFGLEIKIENNLDKSNFLDVTFDLNGKRFKPFSKPNSKIEYVNSKSDHPRNIIRDVPKNINSRLNKLSSLK